MTSPCASPPAPPPTGRAKAAGVSPSTVSYTLRGGAYVSQETPGQVCAIIERNKNTAPVDILH
ncbi:LacI family DNA-binding transcriptional regulator [Bifidobacterium bifidum]|uniref:LacI family DNA-binding transcriptional regulator n=1 Tax=Bifidobacterium bifidum TaxID=1681 RepID=UPI0022DFCE18|nr:LacI family DNA-binding transcriptional regulator [Bifidobacterium bifidum]